jgi:hypothetical protein
MTSFAPGSVCTPGGGPGLQNWGKPCRKARSRRLLRIVPASCLSSACSRPAADPRRAGRSAFCSLAASGATPVLPGQPGREVPRLSASTGKPFLIVCPWLGASVPAAHRARPFPRRAARPLARTGRPGQQCKPACRCDTPVTPGGLLARGRSATVRWDADMWLSGLLSRRPLRLKGCIGVSDLSTLVIWVCARRSIAPRRARVQR